MRIRQHVNPLALGFARVSVEAPRLPPGRPVEVEIGCAEAQFLFERASRDPDRIYVGLEIRDRLVARVNERARAEAAPVEAVFCHVNHHLRALFQEGSVARTYLNFPDPWFKKRHHKRRLVDAALVADIAAVLAPAGALFVQTDVWEIALAAMEAVERRDDLFCNEAGAWSFWKHGNPFGARSWREQHCEQAGLPIWRLYYTRGQVPRV